VKLNASRFSLTGNASSTYVSRLRHGIEPCKRTLNEVSRQRFTVTLAAAKEAAAVAGFKMAVPELWCGLH
jgi:hypothetical protein